MAVEWRYGKSGETCVNDAKANLCLLPGTLQDEASNVCRDSGTSATEHGTDGAQVRRHGSNFHDRCANLVVCCPRVFEGHVIL